MLVHPRIRPRTRARSNNCVNASDNFRFFEYEDEYGFEGEKSSPNAHETCCEASCDLTRRKARQTDQLILFLVLVYSGRAERNRSTNERRENTRIREL